MTFWTYILHCNDDSYYTGHTDNLERRVAEHQSGQIRGHTAHRRPVALVWSQDFGTRIEALEAERRIKGWTRAKKEALIRSDWDALSMLARNRQGSGHPLRLAEQVSRSGQASTSSGRTDRA